MDPRWQQQQQQQQQLQQQQQQQAHGVASMLRILPAQQHQLQQQQQELAAGVPQAAGISATSALHQPDRQSDSSSGDQPTTAAAAAAAAACVGAAAFSYAPAWQPAQAAEVGVSTKQVTVLPNPTAAAAAAAAAASTPCRLPQTSTLSPGATTPGHQPHRVLFCDCSDCLTLASSWLQEKEQQIDVNAVKHLSAAAAAASAAAGVPVESDDEGASERHG
uniref:Uncharacterized protein n=1 Tax=Tetradesmus obliquus TaxID=3088 RepID=A0A383VN04_TETOB